MVYKSLPNDPDGHACCAAQMFLNEGDGVVFRGANGPWKTGDYEYHLKAPAAKDLLELVLKTYSEEHGGPRRSCSFMDRPISTMKSGMLSSRPRRRRQMSSA